jgi:hypothetical protein
MQRFLPRAGNPGQSVTAAQARVRWRQRLSMLPYRDVNRLSSMAQRIGI